MSMLGDFCYLKGAFRLAFQAGMRTKSPKATAEVTWTSRVKLTKLASSSEQAGLLVLVLLTMMLQVRKAPCKGILKAPQRIPRTYPFSVL